MQIETQDVSFSNQSTKNVTFSVPFLFVPSISAIPVDQDVEIFVSNLTTTGLTLNSSANFTGTVKLIATRG